MIILSVVHSIVPSFARVLPLATSTDTGTDSITKALALGGAVLGAYLVTLWLSLIVWTYRDISARTRDILAQVLATLFVVFFSLPGLFIYLILRPKETLAEQYERSLEEEYLLQDIEERDLCPECKLKIQPEWLICPHCRSGLKRECVSCHKALNLGWNACPYCGKV